MPVAYKMSQEMFDSIRFPMYWNASQKKMMRKKNSLSMKEILDYVNSTFGLMRPVNEIIVSD